MNAFPFYSLSWLATFFITRILDEFEVPWWASLLVVLYGATLSILTVSILHLKGRIKDDAPAEEGRKS